MSTLYSLLDHEARSWWWFKKLRAQGHNDEARTLERRSILDTIKHLRRARSEGGYVSVGRGGGTLHFKNGTVSGGHSCEYYLCLGLAAGIPVIDSRSVPNEKVYDLINLPMIAVGRDPDSFMSSLSYRPLAEVAVQYAALGARVYNVEGA